MIRQRIRAGLQRARKAGKVLGRARIEAAIRRSLEKGRGVRETAREMGVGHRTIQRIKGEQQMKEPAGSLGDWHVRVPRRGSPLRLRARQRRWIISFPHF
jgi:DNA invertase Pin-like site-specific DNA recombinase